MSEMSDVQIFNSISMELIDNLIIVLPYKKIAFIAKKKTLQTALKIMSEDYLINTFYSTIKDDSKCIEAFINQDATYILAVLAKIYGDFTNDYSSLSTENKSILWSYLDKMYMITLKYNSNKNDTINTSEFNLIKDHATSETEKYIAIHGTPIDNTSMIKMINTITNNVVTANK